MNLKIKEIAYIAIRILALYFFVRVIESLPVISTYFPFSSHFSGMELPFYIKISMLIPFVANLFTSLILWFAAGKMVGLFVYNHDSDGFKINDGNIGFFELKVIAFTVVGLVLAATAIPQIPNVIPHFVHIDKFDSFPSEEKSRVIFSFVHVIVKLLLGLVLLLKSRDIVRMLKI